MKKLIFKRADEPQPVQSIPQPGEGDRVVYLFHHCVAVEDEMNQFGGWTDSPLTELGHSQGKLVQEFIQASGISVNNLWSSDLPRAIQTAEYIIPVVKSKRVVFTPMARSWGIGTEISGNVKTNQLYRDAKRYYVENPDNTPPGDDAETMHQSKHRWLRFLTYIFSVTTPGQPNGIVCHGNNIKNTAQLYGFGKLKVGHGAVCRVILSADAQMILEVLYSPPGSELGVEDDDFRNKTVRMSALCVEERGSKQVE